MSFRYKQVRDLRDNGHLVIQSLIVCDLQAQPLTHLIILNSQIVTTALQVGHLGTDQLVHVKKNTMLNLLCRAEKIVYYNCTKIPQESTKGH